MFSEHLASAATVAGMKTDKMCASTVPVEGLKRHRCRTVEKSAISKLFWKPCFDINRVKLHLSFDRAEAMRH